MGHRIVRKCDVASLAAANDRLAHAGSTFLQAAFDLLGELAGNREADKRQAIRDKVRAAFDVKIVPEDGGRRRLSLAMPSRDALAALARGFAGLLVAGRGEGGR